MSLTAEEYLIEAHNELRNDASDGARRQVLAAIHALNAVGQLPDVQASLWAKAIQFCPGRDNECGRSWCAYCGEIRQAEEQVEEL